MNYEEHLDSSFIPLRKMLVSYFALKFVRLMRYFSCYHEINYLASHPLIVLFTGIFLFPALYCVVPLRMVLEFFCFCNVAKFLSLIANWWQIMLPLIFGKDARRPTGHSNNFFVSEFWITLIFESSLQRIFFLIRKCFQTCYTCDSLKTW